MYIPLKMKPVPFYYKGYLMLESYDEQMLRIVLNELKDIVHDYRPSKGYLKSVTKVNDRKYTTIFKSPFAHKKAKDTFFFDKHTETVAFSYENFSLVRALMRRTRDYSGTVNSVIKLYCVKKLVKKKFIELKRTPPFFARRIK